MDYSYIQNLLDRYFDCATTTHEERLLRDFFQQEEIPAQFAQYRQLFTELHEEGTIGLPDEFDERLRQRLAALQAEQSPKTLKARIISLHHGLRPLYKAVASVALVITVGVASGEYWAERTPDPVEYSRAVGHDTQSGSSVALENLGESADTLTIDNEPY